RSRRPGELLSSTTLSEHIGIEPAVMDSQIEQLPDLSGYLKFASLPNWQRVTLPVPDSPDGAQTRHEARHFWQHWRTSHAPDAATTTGAANASHSAAKPPTSHMAASHELPLTRDSMDYE
ncbi:MAG TPA: hypothetical protein VNO35_33850, partial [Steroidobacteraceae bacterium]|nr:hypothetical protein [Steroidobacteraceae bacterium]